MTNQNEIEYEYDLIERGRRALQKKSDDAIERDYFSSTQPGRYVFQAHVERLSEVLEKETSKALSGRAVRHNISACCIEVKAYIDYLKHGSIVLSHITLKALLDAYSKTNLVAKKQDIASAIGRRIEDEIWFEWEQRRLGEDEAALMRKQASMPGANPHYRKVKTKKTVQRAVKKKNLDSWDRWTPTHKNKIGLYMLEAAYSAGIVEFGRVIQYGKNQSVVYSEAFMNQILGCEELVMGRAFHAYPLIDLPLDWNGDRVPSRRNNSGGYHLPELRRNQFMCRSFDSDSVFGSKAIDMLNTLQHTAWRVDSRTLSVADHLNENRIPVKSFKVCPFDKPLKGEAPAHVVDDPERFKQWKSDRHREHSLYCELTKNAYRTRQALSMSKEYQHKTFYLSWSLDWRGRFYTQQAWLSPQSTDFEKSLLKFRDGCKLDAASLDWCRASIAAAFNGTRDSFQDRIQWTVDNLDLIERIANNPEGTVSEWEQAKEPWQFLQLCFEWNDVVVTGKEKFWKVPIGVDSTASGLQLLSAMRRDPVGMKYANLLAPETPSAPPEDAYMRVLEVAKGIASNDPSLEHLKPYLEYRSIGKPAVMLSVYGGSHSGIKDDIQSAVNDIENDLLSKGFKVDHTHISPLTTLITKASQKVFPAAYESLKWLKGLARKAHAQGRDSLVWTTPTGDHIHLIKYDIESETVYTAFNGKVNLGNFNSDKPDTKKQVSSFPPSVIHSFDSALLKEAFSDWKHPIATIHDDIRVLPADMDRAMDRIRDAFVSIVDGDPLASIADENGVTEDLHKRLPQLGQDLSCVHQSLYMFN